MLPIEEVRRIDFWEKTPPDQMWEKYRNGLDKHVTRVFASSRARPFVQVKEGLPDTLLGEAAA